MPRRFPCWLKFIRFETYENGPHEGEPRLVYRDTRSGRIVKKPAGWFDPGDDLKFRLFVERAAAEWRNQMKGRPPWRTSSG